MRLINLKNTIHFCLLICSHDKKYTSVEYNNALAKIDVANAYFNQFFHDYDVILTPSACGEAPKGLKSTGNPIFCTIWTYCGMPCISLPLLQS